MRPSRGRSLPLDTLVGAALALLPCLFFFSKLIGVSGWGAEAQALRWPLAYFNGRSLASGTLPIWNPFFFGGMPFLAHPEANVLYPFNLLFAILPPSAASNVYAVSAYSGSAVFTYMLARRLGASRTGGLLAGVVFAFNYARVAVLGHIQVQHTLMWLPLELYLVEQALGARRWGRYSVALGSVVVLQGLGMHPQVFLYSNTVLLGYALLRGSWSARGRPWMGIRLLGPIAAGLLGLGVVVIPGIELLGQSTRSPLDYHQMAQAAGSIADVTKLLHIGIYGLIHPGAGNAEVAIYLGLLPLALSVTYGLQGDWKRRGFIVLLFLLGAGAFRGPLLWILSYIPLYDLFRAPGRMVPVIALGIAILSGLGLDSLSSMPSRRFFPLVGVLCAVLAGWVLLIAASGSASAIPSFLIEGATLICLLASRSPGRWWGAALLLVVLTYLDFMVVSWNVGGGTSLEARDVSDQESIAIHISEAGDARVWRQAYGPDDVSNSNLLGPWPLVTSYNPMMLAALQDVSGFDGSFGLNPDFWPRAKNVLPDMLNVRFLALPRRVLDAPPIVPCPLDGMACEGSEVPQELAAGTELVLPMVGQMRLTDIRLLSWLGNASDNADREEVGDIVLEYEGGEVQRVPLLAGVHTAEWSLDCEAKAQEVRHSATEVWRTWEAGECEGKTWVGWIHLDPSQVVDRIRVRNKSPRSTLVLERVSAQSADGSWWSANFDRARAYRDIESADKIAFESGGWLFLERPSAFGSAWGVSHVEVRRREAMVGGIRGMGQAIDARSTAYIEEGSREASWLSRIQLEALDPAIEVQAFHRSMNALDLRLNSRGSGFLVLSEVYFPGWKVYLDGGRVDLWKVDYLLRGVQVPEGEHVLQMVYDPPALRLGALVSGVGLLLLSLIGILGEKRSP